MSATAIALYRKDVVSVPILFIGVSGMDCVNKAKACLAEDGIAPIVGDIAIEQFKRVGTFFELSKWLEEHTYYTAVIEYDELK